MRVIDLRRALARYLKRKHGKLELLSGPSLVALGDALWVLCEGKPEALPDVMVDFLASYEVFDEGQDTATFVLLTDEEKAAYGHDLS